TIGVILNAEPLALAPPHANLPPGVATIVRRCLEKAPEQRFQSAKDVAFAIAAVDQSPSPVVRASPVPSRERRLWAAAVGVLVIAAAGLAYALYRAHQPAPSRVHLRIAVPQKGTVGHEIGSGVVDAIRQTMSK